MKREIRKVKGKYESTMGDNYFIEDPKGHSSINEIKCCNKWIWLDQWTNTCDTCQSDYNMQGNKLAPRSQWGEETGESLSDILGPAIGDDW